MTEYTDIVEAMRLRIKEEKEKKQIAFVKTKRITCG